MSEKRGESLIAALLSAVLPGAGQLYAGSRRRGVWLLSISALLLLAGLVVLLRDSRTLLKLAFEPSVLVALLFANAGLFLYRTVAAIDAYRGARARVESRWLHGSTIGAVAVILLVPHALFAYYDVVQHDLISTVFATPAVTTTTTPSATPIEPVPTTQAASVGGSGVALPASTTTVVPTTTTAAPRPWDGLGRLNILLLGSDAGVGRTGVRTDTMILASVDVDTGALSLVSIPRNFARVPLPEAVDIWSCGCFPSILNELYQYGESHPDSFPGPATPGANAIKGAVAELVGLPVHFYALVALDGFVDIVDTVGGVTLTVSDRVYDPGYPSEDGGTEVLDIQPGVYEFNGHDALAYARARYSSDDYDRMGRQRCVIEAVVEQADPFTLLRSFPQLAQVIKTSVETDIPLDMVPDLIDLVSLMDTDQALSLRLIPPTYVAGWTEDLYSIPDVELIREHAQIATTLPPAEAAELLGIDPVEDTCG